MKQFHENTVGSYMQPYYFRKNLYAQSFNITLRFTHKVGALQVREFLLGGDSSSLASSSFSAASYQSSLQLVASIGEDGHTLYTFELSEYLVLENWSSNFISYNLRSTYPLLRLSGVSFKTSTEAIGLHVKCGKACKHYVQICLIGNII